MKARRTWLVSCVVLAGCRQIFGIGHPDRAPADAVSDGIAIDVAPDCVAFDVSASADVQLLSATLSRDQGHGTEAVLNIGVGLPSEALLRFAVPALAPGFRLAGLRLTIPFATSSMACGSAATCTSCAPIAMSGMFAAEYATSAWDEATACYNRPSSNGAWQIAGALGPNDRSGIVGTAAYQATTTLVIELDPASAPTWIQNKELSVILTASAGAITIAPQVQFSSIDGTCNPTQAPVVLRFTACP